MTETVPPSGRSAGLGDAPTHDASVARTPISRDGKLSVPEKGIEAWYWVALGSDLRPGGVLTVRLHDERELVLFRGRESRRVFALAPHCAHMGTHLKHGEVLGDELRCPLHHWRFDGNGQCTAAPGCELPDGSPPGYARQRSFPVAESLDSIWVFNGRTPTYDLPNFGDVAPPRMAVAKPGTVSVNCPWFVIAANGYDGQHFLAVHLRELIRPPETRRLADDVFELEFHARVVGRRISDRVTKWLAKDHVTVRIVCWGGVVVTVESRLGTRKPSLLVLAMQPQADGSTRVQGLLPVPRRRFAPVTWLHKALSRWLFVAFLRADSVYLQDMRFRPRTPLPGNEPLQPLLEFLDSLPASR